MRKIGFYGKWLGELAHGIGQSESIAVTEGDRLFYIWEGNYGPEYMVFGSFDEIQNSDGVSGEIKSLVADELGED